MVPASDGSDDVVGIGGPDEGFGAVVGFRKEAFDRGLQIDERAEHAALQPPPGQLGEEALDGIQPGGGGRREMKDKPRMPGEPSANFGVLMGGVIVEHDVDHLAGRNVGFDGIEKRMNSW